MNKLDPASRKLVKAFEAGIDSAVGRSPLLGLPARPLLTFTHDFLFVMLSAPLLKQMPTQGVAETTTIRLAYLLKQFAGRPAAPYAADAEAAIRAYQRIDPTGEHFAHLLAYSHACQVMPEVWRGYYTVEARPDGLALAHVDATFAAAEARDILISELGLNFRFRKPAQTPDRDVAALANQSPVLNPSLLALVVAKKAAAFRHEVAEPSLVSDEALIQVLGFGHETFRRIQAAFNGLSETALEMALFLTAWWQHDHPDSNEMPSEAVEWCSINFKPDFIVELIAAVASVSEDEVNRMIDVFSIDYRKTPAASLGGDGFFPPFARFDDALLFSPLLVSVFLSSRNAIYAFANQSRALVRDQEAKGEKTTDAFGSFVANDLEPLLVSQAIKALPSGMDWIVLEGVKIPGSEIDLVIVDRQTSVALCVQAKAPLPPQGARLTERLGDRCEEGLAQIETFRALPDDVQRDWIGRAAGVSPEGLAIHHGLLARTCFGTADAWAQWPRISLITLATLGLASRAVPDGARPELSSYIGLLETVIVDYLEKTEFRWEPGEIRMAEHVLEVPLLKYDEAFVAHSRERAWSAGPPSDQALPDVLDALSGIGLSPEP